MADLLDDLIGLLLPAFAVFVVVVTIVAVYCPHGWKPNTGYLQQGCVPK